MQEKRENHEKPGAGIAQLQELIAGARRIVGFTGAGISTESGVPDFRTPGSPWMQNKPIPFPDFVQSPLVRREAWRRKFAMDDIYSHAKPARAHRAIARLIAEERMPAVITQNIDGLHQAAGTPAESVIELHGNGTYAACLACGAHHALADIRVHYEAQGDPPDCHACGGIVKSATISFGQGMPAAAMARATALAQEADLFLVLGSSLVVFPAAALPVLAKKSGARLVIVNRQPTALDELADLALHVEIGPLMDNVLACDGDH
jgi:NAD-dependent deacetylase